jgi:hypothetical protein
LRGVKKKRIFHATKKLTILSSKSLNFENYSIDKLNKKFKKNKKLKFFRANESEFEIDNDDDDETDSSFILLYQLMFDRSVNIYLNQNCYYLLFEVSLKINKSNFD